MIRSSQQRLLRLNNESLLYKDKDGQESGHSF